MRIGVLALQGDFKNHLALLEVLGVDAIPVIRATELESVDGLIIPGGESTTIAKLAANFDLFEPIRAAIANGLPVLGTCAGLILLANSIVDGVEGQLTFGGLDVVVRRNAFGGQQESFETSLAFKGLDAEVKAPFIRAPLIESVGQGVSIDATLADGRTVAVSHGNLMGIAFHPEIVGETGVHAKFIELVRANLKSSIS